MADTTPTADQIAALIVFDFSSKRLNFANTAAEIAQQALAAGVSLDDIVNIFVSRLDETDINRLFDDVVAGQMRFDEIMIRVDPSNIAAAIDDLTMMIGKPEVIKSAFWWACRAHLRISA